MPNTSADAKILLGKRNFQLTFGWQMVGERGWESFHSVIDSPPRVFVSTESSFLKYFGINWNISASTEFLFLKYLGWQMARERGWDSLLSVIDMWPKKISWFTEIFSCQLDSLFLKYLGWQMAGERGWESFHSVIDSPPRVFVSTESSFLKYFGIN